MLATTPTTRRSRRDAFTLVEVLVVMAIIVILAGVATVGVMRYLDNAKELVDETRMKNIESAYRSFNIKSGGDNWPQDVSELIMPADGGKAYLEGGQEVIVNPWQIPYTVSIVDTEAGPRPLVSSQRPNGTFTYPKK